ncbi:hypothetical protein CLU79DRAFT_679702, partial [Phycomyces nitens]
SPSKCEVLNPLPNLPLTLYGNDLPSCTTFKYLGIPFSSHGIDRTAIFAHSQKKAVSAMHMLGTLGVHMFAFGLTAAIQAYLIFVRPILEYSLAIILAGQMDSAPLQKAQNACLWVCIRWSNTSIGVVYIATLAALPNMYTRLWVLQAKFLCRALTLPSGSLLNAITTQLDITKAKMEWEKLCHSVLWKQVQHLEESQPRLKDPLKEAYIQLRQKEIDRQLVSKN